MKKFEQKSRKIIRAILAGLGSLFTMNFLAACPGMYGMPERFSTVIQGVIRSKNNELVEGIRISINELNHYDHSNYEGKFYIYTSNQEEYDLIFEDIDGEKNGLFKKQNKKITYDQINNTLQIIMENETDN